MASQLAFVFLVSGKIVLEIANAPGDAIKLAIIKLFGDIYLTNELELNFQQMKML